MENNNNNQQSSFYQFSDQLRLHNSNLATLSLNDSIWSSNTNNNPYGSSKRPDERRNFDIRVGAELNSPAPKIGSDWNGFNDGWKAGSMMNNNNNNNNNINMNSNINSFPGLLNNSNSSSVMGGSHQMNGGFNKGIYSKGGLNNGGFNGGGFNFNVNPRIGKNGKGFGGDDEHQFGGGKVGKKNGGKKSNDSNDNGKDGKDGKQNGVDKRFKTLPATEALPRNETIGGYIFVCNNDTMAENLRRQLFGLPPRYRDSVRAITPGLPLFLYNYSTHQLHGVFEAASFGGTNIDPTAWEDKKCAGESRFPAQVKVVTRKICEPLEEDSFRPILHHYDGPKFRLELNVPEALSLLDIFDDQKA
ncbi:DCD domain-containing protein NRP-A [Linum grandiflorum]